MGGTADFVYLSQMTVIGHLGLFYSKKEDITMSEAKIPYKIYLSEEEMPRAWYNVRADMKVKPAPLLDPATGKPMGFVNLRPVF